MIKTLSEKSPIKHGLHVQRALSASPAIRTLSNASRDSETMGVKHTMTNTQREKHLLSEKLRVHASTIDVLVRDLLSFDGCEDLLRGMSVNKLLACRASIFSTHGGSSSTYKLSSQAERLDAFISHNWSVARWKKYLCLIFYFNTNLGIAVTAVVVSFLVAVSLAGFLPTHVYSESPHPKTWVFSAVGVPVYLFVVFFVRDFGQFVWRGPSIFLDKTCIHQEDAYLQSLGIRKLGAFLAKSKRMMICYSDVYLRKLWTVYEVASFLALHPLSRMDVVPVSLALLSFGATAATWLVNVTSHAFELYYGISGLNFRILCCLILVVIPLTGRSWMRNQAAIQLELENFDIRKTTCAKEDDRRVIYGNIAALMRETGGVDVGADLDEALDNFEDLVRVTLPSALIRSMGAHGLNYKHLLIMGYALSGTQFLDYTAGIPEGLPWRYLLTYFWWYFFVIMVIVPTVIHAIYFLEQLCTGLKGVWDWLYIFLTPAVCVTGPFVAAKLALDEVELRARESDVVLAIWIPASLLLAWIVAAVLLELPLCPIRSERRRLSLQEEDTPPLRVSGRKNTGRISKTSETSFQTGTSDESASDDRLGGLGLGVPPATRADSPHRTKFEIGSDLGHEFDPDPGLEISAESPLETVVDVDLNFVGDSDSEIGSDDDLSLASI